MKNFYNALDLEIRSNLKNNHQNNWDYISRGSEPAEFGYPALQKILNPFRKLKLYILSRYYDLMRPLLRDIIRKFFPLLEYKFKKKNI